MSRGSSAEASLPSFTPTGHREGEEEGGWWRVGLVKDTLLSAGKSKRP
jgi:hypothetical protein